MTLCVNEGKLRACLDRELPEEEAGLVSQHLLECLTCRKRFEELRSTAATVFAAIDSLRPVAEVADQNPDAALARILSVPRRKPVPSRLQVSLACAGLVLLALVIAVTERRYIAPAVSEARKSATGGPNWTPPATMPDAKDDEKAATDLSDSADYLPLDDGEPLQMGFVVRMSLPASVLTPWASSMNAEEIKADVILDEAGRARAVRFLR